MRLLAVLSGCHHRMPPDAIPLAEVVAADPGARRASAWSMPLADARAFLSSSDPAGCPLPESTLSLSACLQANPARGRSPQAPLAWGPAAEQTLWHSRLRCDSGATPRLEQETPGTWLAQCPGDAQPERWFVDPEGACGSPCPPEGVLVMPADALNLEQQVAAALAEQRTGDAFSLAEIGLSRFPQYASTWRVAAVARAATSDHRGALEACDQALSIDPQDQRAAYYAVRAAHSAELWPAARDRAAALRPTLEDPGLHAEVQCIEAIARTRLGDAAGAPLATEACAAGAQGCCSAPQ